MTTNTSDLQNIARQIRRMMIEALRPQESHHIGCSLSIVEILTYLYFRSLKIFPQNPENPNRDIFILSKGHAALALYAVLSLKGFLPKSTFLTYDLNGSKLAEHISNSVPGVEVSTGSLGHGLSIAAGFATSFLNDNKKNKVYVLLSDGEFNEGSTWEAIMYAGHHRLHNLTAIVDLNGFQAYAKTSRVINLSPLSQKIASFNWDVYKINGHNFSGLEKTFNAIKKSKSLKPKCIIARTIKGKGVPFFEGKFESHYLSVTEMQKKEILEELESAAKPSVVIPAKAGIYMDPRSGRG